MEPRNDPLMLMAGKPEGTMADQLRRQASEWEKHADELPPSLGDNLKRGAAALRKRAEALERNHG